MKTKSLLFILACMLAVPGFAQLSKVKTFVGQRMKLEAYFMKVDKISTYDYKSNVLEIYNEDLSLYNRFSSESLLSSSIFSPIEAYKGGSFFATQTLFNDDDLLEFIVRGGDFFAVINENGDVLFRDNVSFYYINFYLVEMSSKIYLLLENDGDLDCIFYEITKSASDAQSAVLKKASSFPNPAKEYINIAYDLQGAAEGSLQIFDMQGKQIAEEKITSNDTSFLLDTTTIQSGMYIVSILSAGKQLSSEKIIVE